MLLVREGCPICGFGNLGLRLCDDAVTVVVMCDECDAVWLDPRHLPSDAALYPQPPRFEVLDGGPSVGRPGSRWAELHDAARAGVSEYIVARGKASDD